MDFELRPQPDETPEQPDSDNSFFKRLVDSFPGVRSGRNIRERQALLEQNGIPELKRRTAVLLGLINESLEKGEHLNLPDALLTEMAPDLLDAEGHLDEDEILRIQEALYRRVGTEFTRSEAVLTSQLVTNLQTYHHEMENLSPDMVILALRQAHGIHERNVAQQRTVQVTIESVKTGVYTAKKAISSWVDPTSTIGIIVGNLTGTLPTRQVFQARQALNAARRPLPGR